MVLSAQFQDFADEFVAFLDSVYTANPRNFWILTQRIGLFGAQETLQTIGERFSITRERVRQIEVQLLQRLYGGKVAQLAKKAFAQDPHLFFLIPKDESASTWYTLSGKRCELAGLLSAMLILNGYSPKYRKLQRGLLIAHPHLSELISSFLLEARKTARYFGIATLRHIGLRPTAPFSYGDLISSIPEYRAVALLEADGAHISEGHPILWFAYAAFGAKNASNRLANVCRKIFAVTTTVDALTLRRSFRRTLRQRSIHIAPPKDVVLELLPFLYPVTIEDDKVIVNTPNDISVLNRIERVIVETIKEAGKAAHRSEITRDVANAGFSIAGAVGYLSWSPCITPCGHGYYSIVGHYPDPAALELLFSEYRRTRSQYEWRYSCGWLQNRRYYVVFEVTLSVLAGGVAKLERPLEDLLADSAYCLYLIQDEVTEKVGSIRTNRGRGAFWGFSVLHSKYGLEEGDFLALEFDPKTAMCFAKIGDESLFDEYGA